MIRDIIEGHNKIVDTLERVGANLQTDCISSIEIWYMISCQGVRITQYAREQGINATFNTQNGRIYFPAEPCATLT